MQYNKSIIQFKFLHARFEASNALFILSSMGSDRCKALMSQNFFVGSYKCANLLVEVRGKPYLVVCLAYSAERKFFCACEVKI